MNSRNPTEELNEAAKNVNGNYHWQNGSCWKQDVNDGKQSKGTVSFSIEPWVVFFRIYK